MNLRPLVPQTSALTKLRHSPWIPKTAEVASGTIDNATPCRWPHLLHRAAFDDPRDRSSNPPVSGAPKASEGRLNQPDHSLKSTPAEVQPGCGDEHPEMPRDSRRRGRRDRRATRRACPLRTQIGGLDLTLTGIAPRHVGSMTCEGAQERTALGYPRPRCPRPAAARISRIEPCTVRRNP